jgi:hypothetical protein
MMPPFVSVYLYTCTFRGRKSENEPAGAEQVTIRGSEVICSSNPAMAHENERPAGKRSTDLRDLSQASQDKEVIKPGWT